MGSEPQDAWNDPRNRMLVDESLNVLRILVPALEEQLKLQIRNAR
jgi:hypothetical protein